MDSEELTKYVLEKVNQAFAESNNLKEMWKDPNKAAQIRTMLDIMDNDQNALKQLNNAMRISLEMKKMQERVDKKK